MPHAVFLISATFLATAAGHIAGDADGYSSQAVRSGNAERAVEIQQVQIQKASETQILRSSTPQRWVF